MFKFVKVMPRILGLFFWTRCRCIRADAVVVAAVVWLTGLLTRPWDDEAEATQSEAEAEATESEAEAEATHHEAEAEAKVEDKN